jgi:hypothetical protein
MPEQKAIGIFGTDLMFWTGKFRCENEIGKLGLNATA